jgi:hypothetical protein
MIEFIKDSVVYKGIIMNAQEHSQYYAGSNFVFELHDKAKGIKLGVMRIPELTKHQVTWMLCMSSLQTLNEDSGDQLYRYYRYATLKGFFNNKLHFSPKTCK